MIDALTNAVLYWMSGFVPRNKRRIVFGAWLGQRFGDNPKYLADYLARQGTAFDLVWCGRLELASQVASIPSVRFVRYGSFAALRAILTCGTCFVTHGFRDVARFNFTRGAQLTYLGHGLALKHMGSPARPLANPALRRIRALWRRAQSFAYYVAVSAEHRRKLLSEYQAHNIEAKRILNVGQPRCDFLVDARSRGREAEVRAQFAARHGVPSAAKVIAYLPTFRDSGVSPFSFSSLAGADRAALERMLERYDAVVLERPHFRDCPVERTGTVCTESRVMSLADATLDTQELLLATDLLVTDYSGCYLDFLILDRPIVHFAYDREYYLKSDRGLYFDLEDVAGGQIVSDVAGLLASLEENLCNPDAEQRRRAKVRNRLIQFETGTSCQQLSRIVLRFEPYATKASDAADQERQLTDDAHVRRRVWRRQRSC